MRAPQEIKAAISKSIVGNDVLLSQTQWWIPTRALEALFPLSAPQDRKMRRYSVMRYLVGKDSCKNLTESESAALVAWAKSDKAQQEAAAILDELGRERGQMSLF